MRRFAILVSLLLAAPVLAQDHSAHMTPSPPAPSPPAPSPPVADPHAGHVMPAPEVDHSKMDHSKMDHGAMAGAMGGGAAAAPQTETPPPAAAGSGPPRAADAIWGADAMRASRRDLQQTHGDYPMLWLQADRAEMQIRNGADAFLWDVQGYYGGTTGKFWFKSEGEGRFGEALEDAELQALYSRAFAPFFDVQAGVRQDVAGPGTTHAVIGIQGLVPYMFEVDAAAFLSHRGDLTARIEAELDQRITQRLIIQPRAEVNLAAQDVPELGIGAGLDSIELGVRLRYEIRREFAPYIGFEQGWRTGRSADFARAAGDDPSVSNIVVGVRLWF